MQLGVTNTNNPVWYSVDHTGPGGGRYNLYAENVHSSEDLLKAKIWIRNNLDAISIKILKYSEHADEIIRQAKSDIEHFEETHNLKL